MCGILGALRAGNRLDVCAIERGRDVLAHRGPDGEGLWEGTVRDGGAHVVLAHRRLSILDLSPRGAQPLLVGAEGMARPAAPGECGGASAVLVFNGEIYNYVELREELRGRGHSFQSDCDTEVLLVSYREWGERCLERLNGMFAFAIWDADAGKLFCARDRLGEKPFYYVLDAKRGLFAFASEVKALVAAGIARAELDPRAVYRYFRFREQAGVEETIWAGVRKLPAAHAIVVRAEGQRIEARVHRYWDLDLSRNIAASEEETVAEFRALFADSVRIRLRSDVRVGTSLSGGIDSSSVLCQIHRLGADAGQLAFTARMDDPTLDEGRHVDAVLRATGLPGVSDTPRADDLLAEFDRLYYHQEEPFPSTSLFASYIVSRLAAQHGVVVMLDGQGADEILAGYAHYPALILDDLARQGRFVAWHAERDAVRRRMGVDPVPPRAALRRWFSGAARNGHSLLIDEEREAGFLDADLRARFAGEEGRRIGPVAGALRTRLYADTMLGHLQELLRYADRNSMAFSREVRLPFLDHRLVALCFALPPELILRRGVSKWLLRRSMRGIVPDAILDRADKVGFQTPWAEWWNGACGRALRDRLACAERSLAGVVTPGAVPPASAAALEVMGLASAREQLAAVAPAGAAV